MAATIRKHTPGPWGFDRHSGEIYRADGDVTPHIGAVDFDNTADEQAIADGYLIQAAPDLLDVAQMLLAVTGTGPDRFRYKLDDVVLRARAAVANATETP